MPERAPVLRNVPMQMLKSQPGFPKGFIVSVGSALFDPETGTLKELQGQAAKWDAQKIAAPLVLPMPTVEERPVELPRVVLVAQKIFTSPAVYPGDVFGVEPDVAARYMKNGAARIATHEDLRKFYDPNRGLAPEKQAKAPETSPEMLAAAASAGGRSKQPEPIAE